MDNPTFEGDLDMLEGQNIICLDLETAKSAEDCRHCGGGIPQHTPHAYCIPPGPTRYEKIGWDNKQALGLSIGCYFDYQDRLFHWFDGPTLETTMQFFVDRQPLMVSFNGLQFDFALMRGILRRQAEALRLGETPSGRDITVDHAADLSGHLTDLCDAFKVLCTASYDILHEIWTIDPARKFERGLNSLGAISVANGYGTKEMDGAKAPQLWRQGRYAEVLNYCQSDVLKTKQLFEQIVTTGQILRGDGLPIHLPRPEQLISMASGQL